MCLLVDEGAGSGDWPAPSCCVAHLMKVVLERSVGGEDGGSLRR